jgi:hypothetical protein
VVTENNIKKNTGGFFRRDRILNSSEMNHLAETINKNNNTCVHLADSQR